MLNQSPLKHVISAILFLLMLPSTLLSGIFSVYITFAAGVDLIRLIGQGNFMVDGGSFIFFLIVGPLPIMALIALWWLFFKFRTIQMSEMPKVIWLGLLCGVISMLVINFSLFSAGMPQFWSNVGVMFLNGVGPFIAMCMMLWHIKRYHSSLNHTHDT